MSFSLSRSKELHLAREVLSPKSSKDFSAAFEWINKNNASLRVMKKINIASLKLIRINRRVLHKISREQKNNRNRVFMKISLIFHIFRLNCTKLLEIKILLFSDFVISL